MLWFPKVLTQKTSQVGEKFPAKILFGVFWVGEVYVENFGIRSIDDILVVEVGGFTVFMQTAHWSW